MSHAEAIRSICGRGRVTHVLPGGGSEARWRPAGARAPTEWRLQIVDGLDPVELPFDAIELAAKLSDGAPVVRPVPIELREDLPTPFHGRLILESPGLVEERGDLLLCHVPYPVDMQQRRLTTERLDLLHQPLKELGGFCCLRKDPGRPA